MQLSVWLDIMYLEALKKTKTQKWLVTNLDLNILFLTRLLCLMDIPNQVTPLDGIQAVDSLLHRPSSTWLNGPCGVSNGAGPLRTHHCHDPEVNPMQATVRHEHHNH